LEVKAWEINEGGAGDSVYRESVVSRRIAVYIEAEAVL